jgi:catechol 2,3-dioxygenase-like lactoylglutathione lyase family enzyme
MSDPLERLRTPIVPVAPRGEFAEALRRRIAGGEPPARDTATIRYFVDELDVAVTFYRDLLGFDVELRPSPTFAMLYRGDLRLLLSVPGEPHMLPDGTLPAPGGHNRMALVVGDLGATVTALRRGGARMATDIVAGVAVDTALVQDPAGNPVELIEPRPGYHERGGAGTRLGSPDRPTNTTEEESR